MNLVRVEAWVPEKDKEAFKKLVTDFVSASHASTSQINASLHYIVKCETLAFPTQDKET